jgi:hypothetical protein
MIAVCQKHDNEKLGEAPAAWKGSRGVVKQTIIHFTCLADKSIFSL